MTSRYLASLALAAFLTIGSAPAWAVPARIDGIDNFRQVNGHIYRGAQPDESAWPTLAKLGVKTVIDLRRQVEHSTADEARAVAAAGMRYVNFPMNGFDTPTREQMAQVLALMDGPDPVFVHCKQGRDRTGTVVATWRMEREQWPSGRALTEALDCGMHWYEAGMKRFIAGYRVAPPTTVAQITAAPATDSLRTGSATATATSTP